MKVLSLMVGPIMTNCYILCDEEARVCAVIDPGDEAERIAAMVASSGCTPIMILLTHGHFDHCTGVAGLLEKWPELPVYIHTGDVTDDMGGELRFHRLVEGQGVLFAGDTLFRGSCGRCDFPGGDYRAMLRSLARLAALEGQYTVYPGHDSATDMDFERKYNPYMKQGMNV